MAPSSTSVTQIEVDTITFPPAVKAPASGKTLFLSGAGVRGLEIDGKSVKLMAIGVYLEDKAVPVLAAKWKGKTAEELMDSVDFFRNVVAGPFEKLTQVIMISPLTGQQFAEEISANSVALLKSIGIDITEKETKAIDKLLEGFKAQNFPSGSSVIFTHLPHGSGSLAITFSKDGSVPEVENFVIEDFLLPKATLDSIICKGGTSPSTRKCMASRLAELIENEELIEKSPQDGN